MNDSATGAISLYQLANEIGKTYDQFCTDVAAMGSKTKSGKRNSKFGASVVGWLAGSHVRTEREVVCEGFAETVEKQLEFLAVAMEGAEPKECQEACEVLVDVMLEPQPVKSNSTSVLMKRAMVGKLIPMIPYMSQDLLQRSVEKMNESYPVRQQLPIEKELIKAMNAALKNR